MGIPSYPASAKPVGVKSQTDVETWKQRIRRARTRRERNEKNWEVYARLHTLACTPMQDLNEDENIRLPSGDQVKIGLVHRNLEQTFAMLDIPRVSVKAKALDYRRELGTADTHRESLVEYATQDSLYTGGVLGYGDADDACTRDAVMIGHGIVYSWWRTQKATVPGEAVPELVDRGDGTLIAKLDETGAPSIQRLMEEKTVYEAVEDEYVSPLEFLFDASAMDIRKARWQGREVITTPAALEEAGFALPAGIDWDKSGYRRRTLYGEDPQTEETFDEGSVKHITVWDRETRELIHFVESCTGSKVGATRKGGAPSATIDLYEIGRMTWPVMFDHPDKTPFEVLILIPANDNPFGVSQVESIKTLSSEADKLRTRAANMTRQQKLLLLYRLGMGVSKEDMEAAMAAPEGSTVGVHAPDDKPWKDLVHMIQSPGTPPEVYKQIEQAIIDVDQNTGVSAVAQGGAETATESERIFNIGGARVSRKRQFKLEWLTRIADTHRCFHREFAAEGQEIIVPDVDGAPMVLTYGRAAFQGRFRMEVLAGDTGMSAVRQKMISDVLQKLFRSFGPQFDLALLRSTLTMFDVPNVEGLMRAARANPMTLIGGGAPGPGAPPADAAAMAANAQNGQAIRAATNVITESRR